MGAYVVATPHIDIARATIVLALQEDLIFEWRAVVLACP